MVWDPFAPLEGRTPSVVVARNRQYNQARLILTTPACSRTEVMVINEMSGRLERAGDYATEDEALMALHAQGFAAEHRASALLGFVATGCVAGALLASKTREKGVLPGGHAVHVVVDANWLLLPLGPLATAAAAAGVPQGALPTELLPSEEMDFWRSIQAVTLDNAHYYCWTADLTRPFPSFHPAQDPEPEFAWNTWLAEPLHETGWHGRCPVLLQGAIEISLLPTSAAPQRGPSAMPGTLPPPAPPHTPGNSFAVALLSRRSRRHPGTRYLARGLNERSGPGNEIECELVAWRLERGAAPRVRWARCAWRRGTVPIWWGVNLASLQKGLAAEVYIRERDPYKGTASYFRRVQRALARGADEAARAGGGDEALGVRIPITCVNLLHCNPAKASELLLSSHFQESMRAVRRKLPAGAPIRVVNFDWHGNVGRLGEEKGIEGFWSFMEPFLKETGFSAGVIQEAGKQEEVLAEGRSEGVVNGDSIKSGTADPDAASEQSDAGRAEPAQAPLTWWPPAATVRWESRQRGILRYNCADSLDRTNAATCFGSLPVLQEMLRAIDVDIAVEGLGGATPGPLAAGVHASRSLPNLSPSQGRASPAPALPPGWELRWHEGRPLFVDHIRRRTQWEAPAFAASGGAPRAATPGRDAEAPGPDEQSSARDPGANSADSGHVTAPETPSPHSAPSPWQFFRFRDLAEVRSSLRRDVLAEHAEAFRLHGDVHSFLYTGSPAMHSQVLGLLTGGARLAAGGVGKLQNLAVALQRRWNNAVSDGARQASLLLFLGLRLREQFPRLRLVYADACREVEEEAEDEDLEIAQQLSRLELAAAEERRAGRVGEAAEGDVGEAAAGRVGDSDSRPRDTSDPQPRDPSNPLPSDADSAQGVATEEPETRDLLTLLDDPPQTSGGGDSNGGAPPEQASPPLLDPLGALTASDSASPPPRERLRSFALSNPDSPPDLLL